MKLCIDFVITQECDIVNFCPSFLFLSCFVFFPCLPLFLSITSSPFFLSLSQVDRLEVSGLAASPNALSSSSDGGGAYGIDSVDSTPDPQRTKQAISQLQQKILKLTEQIKIEQTARDDNVAEYLKLANNADKQQSARIKQVFEKKNQKSAQTIQQLQRKLEHYHRKLREVEHNGIPRQPKDVLRDMHQGLKDVGAKVLFIILMGLHYGTYVVHGNCYLLI